MTRAWKAAAILVALPGVWQVGLVLYTVAHRIAYPYDLEWMEGGLLDHAARIQEGSGLYAPASVEFIPYLYTPLYPALLALLGEPLGLGYGLGRAVAALALAVALGVIATAGMRHAGDGRKLFAAAAGALGCGVAASAYPWVEGWYDIVRGDMLFVAMIAVGLALLARPVESRARPTPSDKLRVAAAAALLALSFFCKQHGIWFVGAGGLALLAFRRWRLIPIYVAVAGAIGLGFTLLLQLSTDGWFWTYIYEVLRGHDFQMPRFRSAFPTMLGRAPAATAVIAATASAIALRHLRGAAPGGAARRFLYWLPAYAMALVAGAFGWGHQWAHFNAYVPFVFFEAIAVACALPAIAEMVEARRWLGRLIPLLAAAAVSVQLIALAWTPSTWIPRAADRAAGDALIARLAAIDGEILIPAHPWYARLAGKRTQVHRMGLMDMQWPVRHEVRGLTESLASHRYAAVILDRWPEFWLRDLPRYYRPDEILPREQRPRTVTGARTAPRHLWRPDTEDLPPGARALFNFESGTYSGWTVQSTAWGTRPASRRLREQGKIFGARGRFWASSFHGGDPATGTLTSPPFTISGRRLTARISGGDDDGVRAELRVDGEVVATARGNNNEALAEVEWNVDAHRGKRATIVLVDEATGSWGHLSADEFLLWD
jgi:hypothetical protein